MDFRFTILCVTSLLSLLATASANAATVVLPDSTGATAGLTRIECVPDGGAHTHQLRGAIIDTGIVDISYEVILTTAHGLPTDVDALRRSCRVVGADNGRYRIESVWRPDSRGRGSVDDWAVLLTERRLSGAVKRLRSLAIDHAARQRMTGDEMPVRLPLRSLGSERACSLTPPGSLGMDLTAELFGHTCRAWSGHSGSPILTIVEDEVYLLGIHLGSRWIVEEHAALEIGRYLDATILEAIHAATARRRESGRSE